MGTPFTHTTWQVKPGREDEFVSAGASGPSGATGRGSALAHGCCATSRARGRSSASARGRRSPRFARWRGEPGLPRAGRAAAGARRALRAADAGAGRRDLSLRDRYARRGGGRHCAVGGDPRRRGARLRRQRAGARGAHGSVPGRPLPEGARRARGAGRPRALRAPGGGLGGGARGEHVAVVTGTASGKSLAFNLPGARRARARAEEARALPLPDEGARPGPAPLADRAEGAARPAGDLRRRHRGRAPVADPQVVEPRAHRTRTCSTSASCPTTTAGATCSRTSPTSSSTRRTSTAACSARTSATSSAASAGSRGSTAPSRSSCSPRRRSRTPPGSRAPCSAST